MSDIRSVQQAYGAHGLNLSDVPLSPLSSYGTSIAPSVLARREAQTQPSVMPAASASSSREIIAAHYKSSTSDPGWENLFESDIKAER